MSEFAIIEDHAIARAGDEQLVTMKIDGQLFGLPILKAQDIVETHTITQVPMAPSAVAGVMNLRGRIVTVINLRRILGEKDNVASRMGVTVEHGGDLYTILVDEIGEVMSVESADREPVPNTLNSEVKNLCTGIYRLETGLLALLDIDQILNADTILQTPEIDFSARRRLQEQLEEETLAQEAQKKEDTRKAQEAKAKTESEARAKAKAGAKTKADAEAKADAKAKAAAKVEAEAKAKAAAKAAAVAKAADVPATEAKAGQDASEVEEVKVDAVPATEAKSGTEAPEVEEVEVDDIPDAEAKAKAAQDALEAVEISIDEISGAKPKAQKASGAKPKSKSKAKSKKDEPDDSMEADLDDFFGPEG